MRNQLDRGTMFNRRLALGISIFLIVVVTVLAIIANTNAARERANLDLLMTDAVETVTAQDTLTAQAP